MTLGEGSAVRADDLPVADPDDPQDAPEGRDRRLVLAAIVVGGALRLAWVIWATRTPQFPSDPSEYIRIALELTKGDTPTFGGTGGPSAYWSPGYPFVLAPFLWVADTTGWLSPAFAAALVNTVAGTLTIWFTALLAERWIGVRARVAAAWLVALAPALIYYTATAPTETAFTPVFLGTILLAGSRDDEVPSRNWVLAGLLVGLAVLFRAPGVIGVAVPVLALRTRRGSFRAAWPDVLRATGLVLAGAAVLLVPWTIRNGVQVGIWSPGSTSNASALCFGHNDDISADWETSLANEQLQVECFRGSPYDDADQYRDRGLPIPPGVSDADPDEVGWYTARVSDAVSWATSHPVREVSLTAHKVWETWNDEGRAVDSARNYERQRWAGTWHTPLSVAANLWLWAVVLLALAAMVLVPRCRSALPIWVPIVLFTLAIVGAVAQPHYRFPVMPLVAVLAAGLLSRRAEAEAT